MTIRTLVLGSGTVGRAAAWDLNRRGHEVTVADAAVDSARRVGDEIGLSWEQLDATDGSAVAGVLATHDCVVAAVPYPLGETLASAAVTAKCHYFDFGGNPAIVKRQLSLDAAARAAGVAVVLDCGLAPGLANVVAEGLIDAAPGVTLDSVQIRVGVLPQVPNGTLEYELSFNAGGLINEYAEPCEIIQEGVVRTVEPLTRFEQIDWNHRGTLEAFATAGGTSTMCQKYAGTVRDLEYKTIRYPGHGRIFAAMGEIGLFDSKQRRFGDTAASPRSILIDLLTDRLPRGGDDVALVSVAVSAPGYSAENRIEDTHDGTFSSLARMTAFPTTALCDLVARGEVGAVGAAAMHAVAPPNTLMNELKQVGIAIENR